MSNTMYGKYYPVSSRIHHMNSTSKIICILLFMLTLTVGTSLPLMGLMILLAVMIMWLSKVPFDYYWNSVKGMKYIIILLVVIDLIFKANYIDIILIVTKMITGTLYTMILTYTTSSTEITYGLETIFKPLEYLKIPVSKLALAVSLALKFIPTIFEQADKILKSQASRGIDFGHSDIKGKIKALTSMILPMFILSFKRNDNLADAMEVRLYNFASKRTNYRMNKWNSFDDFMVTIHLFILALFVIERFML